MKKTESKTKRVNLFKKRLDTYYDELKQLYLDIYHDENAFNYFVTMLKKNYRERKASLRKSDIETTITTILEI